ncbi:MAG TPA: hypothetical protein ENI48_07740 [Thioploca sp.]|nr:hypothetical protein [Thioploca sp.]
MLSIRMLNKFSVGIAETDVLLVLRRNGKPQIVLNASHMTVKALAIQLNEIIKEFEQQTNSTILTFDKIRQSIGKTDDSYRLPTCQLTCLRF